MGKLIYFAISSLDGYHTDERGNFDFYEPNEEVHAFINDLVRPAGTHLYGRKMYEVMSVWDDASALGDDSPHILDFAAIWQAADKIVYSRTLESVSTARTRIEREFDPAAVRDLKSRQERDLMIGGPELASHAIRAGLVDEYRLFWAPVIIGGGAPALPPDVQIGLELLDERRFRSGFVYLRYRAKP